MGATQSKKRRKDKLKKKRGSVSLDIPRSASMGTLRPSDSTTGSSACPLCPHCRSSVSWSSDHSLIHSLCLYHARQGCEEALDTNAGEERGEAWGKVGFESCPDCFHSPPNISQGCPRLCEISNQDYDEMSTMSLNRHMSGRLVKPAAGIVQSRSADFPDLVHRKQHYSQTKENVNPDTVCYSYNQPVSLRKKTTTESHHTSMTSFTDNKRRPSSSASSLAQEQNVNIVVMSAPSSRLASPSPQLPQSPPELPQSPPAATSSGDISHDSSSKATKSNLSLLEDEEDMVSRWVKRKQMAQELRNLRMHLQNEEVVKQQTISQTSSISYNPLTDNNNTDEKTVKETFTSTTRIYTNAPVTTEVGSSNIANTDSHQFDDLSHTNTSKESDSTCVNNDNDSNSTTTTSPMRRSLRSKFSRLGNYRYLDSHPVMTRLQNEQNNRLELMERRMEEIRISAMQEAERRKFAEIFPAKNDDSETQKLMREARESLERMKEEKRKKAMKGQQHQQYYQNETSSGAAPSGPCNMTFVMCEDADSRSREDSGEIIPVRVLSSSSREVTPVGSSSRRQKIVVSGSDKGNQSNQPFWLKSDWPDINLSQPLTWLWLPFMLFPLVLRMLLSTIINSLSSPTTPRNNNSANPAATTSCNNLDRGRNLSKQKRKRSC